MLLTLFFSRSISIIALSVLLCVSANLLQAQQPVPASLVNDIVQKQIDATAQENLAYEYILHKSDKRGDVVRMEIATPFGNVARTISRQGRPLNAEETAYEIQHLRKIIQSESEQKKRTKAAADSRKDTLEIVNAMRTAMIYTLRPGQPQISSFSKPQIAIDFKPNPAFHPESMAQEGLQGVAGTLWIDAKTHLIRRVEARSEKDFNILFGIAVKVYAGATLTAEQREFSPGKLMYSKLKVDAKLREFLFKTVNYHTSQEATDVQRLSDGLSLAAAAKMLIEMPNPHYP
ncbi:MAG: hypothetical protein JSS87_11935 [Acidobacteria bacterium]|nr:hypothetical protein [Acidobacteriota bacterium]